MRLFNIISSVFNKNIICINNKNSLEFFIRKFIYQSINNFFKFSIFFKKNVFLFFILFYESIFISKSKLKYNSILSNYYIINNKMLKISINSKNEKINSIENIFGNSRWAEREAKEFFNINYNNKSDNRSLYLWSGFLGNPLKKNYPTIGFFEISVKYKLGLHFKKIIHV